MSPSIVQAGSARLAPDAAASYARALAAGAPDSVTSSYRDYNAQMRLYQGWLRRLPGYNFALHPDKSDHCKGLAVDLRGAAAKAWFRAHGASYGWLFTDKTEDWHIAYRSAYDTHRNDAPPAQPVAQDWFDMATPQDLHNVIVSVLRAPEFDVSAADKAYDVITRWYVDLLGRAGTPAEVESRVSDIVNKSQTYASHYAAIYNSQEARNFRAKKAA